MTSRYRRGKKKTHVGGTAVSLPIVLGALASGTSLVSAGVNDPITSFNSSSTSDATDPINDVIIPTDPITDAWSTHIYNEHKIRLEREKSIAETGLSLQGWLTHQPPSTDLSFFSNLPNFDFESFPSWFSSIPSLFTSEQISSVQQSIRRTSNVFATLGVPDNSLIPSNETIAKLGSSLTATTQFVEEQNKYNASLAIIAKPFADGVEWGNMEGAMKQLADDQKRVKNYTFLAEKRLCPKLIDVDSVNFGEFAKSGNQSTIWENMFNALPTKFISLLSRHSNGKEKDDIFLATKTYERSRLPMMMESEFPFSANYLKVDIDRTLDEDEVQLASDKNLLSKVFIYPQLKSFTIAMLLKRYLLQSSLDENPLVQSLLEQQLLFIQSFTDLVIPLLEEMVSVTNTQRVQDFWNKQSIEVTEISKREIEKLIERSQKKDIYVQEALLIVTKIIDSNSFNISQIPSSFSISMQTYASVLAKAEDKETYTLAELELKRFKENAGRLIHLGQNFMNSAANAGTVNHVFHAILYDTDCAKYNQHLSVDILIKNECWIATFELLELSSLYPTYSFGQLQDVYVEMKEKELKAINEANEAKMRAFELAPSATEEDNGPLEIAGRLEIGAPSEEINQLAIYNSNQNSQLSIFAPGQDKSLQIGQSNLEPVRPAKSMAMRILEDRAEAEKNKDQTYINIKIGICMAFQKSFVTVWRNDALTCMASVKRDASNNQNSLERIASLPCMRAMHSAREGVNGEALKFVLTFDQYVLRNRAMSLDQVDSAFRTISAVSNSYDAVKIAHSQVYAFERFGTPLNVLDSFYYGYWDSTPSFGSDRVSYRNSLQSSPLSDTTATYAAVSGAKYYMELTSLLYALATEYDAVSPSEKQSRFEETRLNFLVVPQNILGFNTSLLNYEYNNLMASGWQTNDYDLLMRLGSKVPNIALPSSDQMVGVLKDTFQFIIKTLKLSSPGNSAAIEPISEESIKTLVANLLDPYWVDPLIPDTSNAIYSVEHQRKFFRDQCHALKASDPLNANEWEDFDQQFCLDTEQYTHAAMMKIIKKAIPAMTDAKIVGVFQGDASGHTQYTNLMKLIMEYYEPLVPNTAAVEHYTKQNAKERHISFLVQFGFQPSDLLITKYIEIENWVDWMKFAFQWKQLGWWAKLLGRIIAGGMLIRAAHYFGFTRLIGNKVMELVENARKLDVEKKIARVVPIKELSSTNNLASSAVESQRFMLSNGPTTRTPIMEVQHEVASIATNNSQPFPGLLSSPSASRVTEMKAHAPEIRKGFNALCEAPIDMKLPIPSYSNVERRLKPETSLENRMSALTIRNTMHEEGLEETYFINGVDTFFRGKPTDLLSNLCRYSIPLL